MNRLITLVFLFMSLNSVAQVDIFEKEVSVDNKKVDVKAELVDQIKISNWNKDKVGFKVTYSLNEGDLNEAVKISIDEGDSRIRFEVELEEDLINNADFIDCGEEHTTYWRKGGEEKSICIEIDIEVYLPQNVRLDVESVLGDLLIEGLFESIQAKTVTGDIDIKWPEGQGAELDIKTVNGAIYTDHEFDVKEDRGLPLISSHEIKTKIGEGQKIINLETVTSDIYFRKN